jgi:hypothetical protein
VSGGDRGVRGQAAARARSTMVWGMMLARPSHPDTSTFNDDFPDVGQPISSTANLLVVGLTCSNTADA